VAVASGMLLVGWFATMASSLRSPASVTRELGKEFWPEFKDPTAPDRIEVQTFDEKKGEGKKFEVKSANGKWIIPSHSDYPADAKERLEKAAASCIGIKREELRSQSTRDHASLGVRDPAEIQEGDSIDKIKGCGRRIALFVKTDPVFELIVGNQLENRPGFYFVRKPGDAATYVARIDVDVPTNFSDWVETDLLKFDRDDLTKIEINRDSFEKRRNQIALVVGERMLLTRLKPPADPWKLEGTVDPGDEVDQSKINAAINTLDSLKLLGIRAKPEALKEFLGGNLKPERAREINQGLQGLFSKGFYPDLTDPEKPVITPLEGGLSISTKKGVAYQLSFGDVISGDEFMMQTGLEQKGKDGAKKGDSKKADDKTELPQTGRYVMIQAMLDRSALTAPVRPTPPAGLDDAPPAAKPAKPTDKPAEPTKPADTPAEPAKPDDKPAEPAKPDDKPVEPAKPAEKPAEPAKPADPAEPKKTEEPKPEGDGCQETPGETEAKPADAKPADAKPEEDKPAGAKPEGEKPADAKPGDAKPAEPAKDPKAEPAEPANPADAKPADANSETKPQVKSKEDLKKEYQFLLKTYEGELATYNKQVADAKDEVRKLNARFDDWYYVISAEDFKTLKITRKELVKAKVPEIGSPENPGDSPPEVPGPPADEKPATKPAEPAQPDTEKPVEPAKPEEKKPEEKKPEAVPEKPAEPKSEKPAAPDEEKPDEEKKPDEKKPDETPPEEEKPEDKPAEPAQP